MKKYLIILLLLAVAGAGVGFYMYNKPHKNMERASADLKIEAEALFTAFEEDESAANSQYLDKVVQVEGTVKEVSKDENGNLSLTLDSGSDMFGIICQFDELTEHGKTDFKAGDKVSLKGICTGKLMDVVLVRCVEV